MPSVNREVHPHQTPDLLHLDLGCPAPRTVSNKCVLLKPLGLWHICDSSSTRQTKTETQQYPPPTSKTVHVLRSHLHSGGWQPSTRCPAQESLSQPRSRPLPHCLHRVHCQDTLLVVVVLSLPKYHEIVSSSFHPFFQALTSAHLNTAPNS